MDDEEVSDDGQDISLINKGITSLKELRIQGRPLESFTSVHNLLLHCNSIRRIENLDCLVFLKNLDLSSNAIEKITGLESLVSLRCLNLACNKIHTIEGISNLRELRTLDISNNAVESLVGLREVRGDRYSLASIDLHGNAINRLEELGNFILSFIFFLQT